MPRFTNTESAEKWAHKTLGCSVADALRFNDGLPLNASNGKAKRYEQQRHAAAKRGISWEFTFESWVALWNSSGRWSQRGVGRSGYCMARNGDKGPYSPKNVVIEPSPANSRDGLLHRMSKSSVR